MTAREASPGAGPVVGAAAGEMPRPTAGRARTLSRHVVHTTNGCLVVTLPADLDTEAVEELHALLDDISHRRHRGLVLDLSAVDILPSRVATALVQLAHAARLLHSPAVICGISPDLAAALVLLDIGFEDVPKAQDMDHALALIANAGSTGEARR